MRATGYLLVLSGSALWATNGIASTFVFDAGAISPTDLTALRIFGSALVLGAGVVMLLPGLSRSSLTRLALFGVFGVSLPQWLFYEAISRIDVPIALVIVYTAPVLVTAYERIARRRSLPLRVYLAILVAIGGVVGTVLGGSGGPGALSAAGLAFAVAAMVAYSGQILLATAQPSELSPLQRIGGAMVFGSLIWVVVDPPWTLPFRLVDDRISLGSALHLTAPTGLLVAYIIVLGTIVPYAMLVAGAPRIGAGAASVTGMAEPVVAAILAWALLGQRLSGIQVGGIAVALCGVALAETLRSRTQRLGIVEETIFAS